MNKLIEVMLMHHLETSNMFWDLYFIFEDDFTPEQKTKLAALITKLQDENLYQLHTYSMINKEHEKHRKYIIE